MDYFTDMSEWQKETDAFLIKIGQVETKPTKSKKDEE
jgi:hypothetical protein